MTLSLVLPIVNGSAGVWGTMLNTALTQVQTDVNANTDKNTTQDTDITSLKSRVTTLENKPATQGMLLTCLSSNRPTPVVGQIVLETDTGYLYYVQNVSGVPTRIPWPGSYLGQFRQTVAQSIATGVTGAGITLDTKDFDRLGGWNGTSRYTCQVRGMYEFTGSVAFANNATGYRSATWNLNGVAQASTRVSHEPISSGVSTVIGARSKCLSLNVGDYVELFGYQSSGAALTTEVTTSHQSGVNVKYLGYYGS